MPNLALGPCRVETALPGFRTFAQNGIVLQVNSNRVINVTLEAAQEPNVENSGAKTNVFEQKVHLIGCRAVVIFIEFERISRLAHVIDQ